MSYIPYQHNYYQPNYYGPSGYNNTGALRPKSSVDSVKIDIINPKTSLEPAGYDNQGYGYPAGYYYPPHYYVPNAQPANNQNIYNNYSPQTTQNNTTGPIAPNNLPQPVPQPQPQPAQPQPQQNQPQPQPPKQPEKPEQKPLTPPPEPPKEWGNVPEDLIKAIDNGLSNPSSEVRVKAATKLLRTYEKYHGAQNHPALTVLLNRALKDPHQNVRLFGEIALQTGAAAGNDDTQNIIRAMTTSKKAYGQDALAANQILLNMADRDKTRPSHPPVPPPPTPDHGNKPPMNNLNLVT